MFSIYFGICAGLAIFTLMKIICSIVMSSTVFHLFLMKENENLLELKHRVGRCFSSGVTVFGVIKFFMWA